MTRDDLLGDRPPLVQLRGRRPVWLTVISVSAAGVALCDPYEPVGGERGVGRDGKPRRFYTAVSNLEPRDPACGLPDPETPAETEADAAWERRSPVQGNLF